MADMTTPIVLDVDTGTDDALAILYAISHPNLEVLAISCDVSKAAPIQAACDQANRDFGKVDILVACQGRHQRKPTLDVTESEYAAVLDTNLTGTFRACQVFGRHMLAAGGGTIVRHIVSTLTSRVLIGRNHGRAQ